MDKITLELTENEFRVVVNALQYAKAYKGMQMYGIVLKNIVERLKSGISKYYIVQGILDDGISRYPKVTIIKARNPDHAVAIARAHLESEADERFTITAVGEATKNYAIYEVL